MADIREAADTFCSLRGSQTALFGSERTLKGVKGLCTIRLATWNVSSLTPSDASACSDGIREWLCGGGMGSGGEGKEGKDGGGDGGVAPAADICVVGLQEVVPLGSVESSPAHTGWKEFIQGILGGAVEAAEGGEDDTYVLLRTTWVEGVLLTVFIKRKHITKVTQLTTQSVECGGGRAAGGGGAAVGIGLCFAKTSISLVSVQLAGGGRAGNEAAGRNSTLAYVECGGCVVAHIVGGRRRVVFVCIVVCMGIVVV